MAEQNSTVYRILPDWAHEARLDSRLMPLVFRYRGFRFFFYANEGTPREPVHIHVARDGVEAKFWLRPEVSLAYNGGYGARTLVELAAIVRANQDLIERTWHDFFGG